MPQNGDPPEGDSGMSDFPPLTTQTGRFVDPQGRQVILHGINLVNKDPEVGYLGPEDIKTFAAFRRWGFNCVRLGIIWDGLEPEPGVYNEAYLQGIDRRIAWAKANNLYVFLDMHQDLYSVLYADGAPAWATLSDGQQHIHLGGVWSDAYFTSPAVQAALDNFWKNAPAPDGMGLQEHYARAWAILARRYADEPAVIGYDLLNEPFPGSAAAKSQALWFARGAELLSQLDGPEAPSAESLAAQWLDPEERFQILQRLKDVTLYTQIIDVTQSIYNEFEQSTLQNLYQRVTKAIREVDIQRIVFLETSMGSNMGVYSGIEPLAIGGQRDPQQAYAPHGYDLVVDTARAANASAERVALIFSRHAETAQRWGWPMVVGEWGAYDMLPGTLPAARDVVRVLERILCSDIYWTYEPNFDMADSFPALWRPYPERVAGRLESYGYDPRNWSFECAWQEDPVTTAPSIIYLPGWLGFDGTSHDTRKPIITPSGDYQIHTHAGGVWLHIPPTGLAIRRMLKI
jgi:endoglycosylceramidase